MRRNTLIGLAVAVPIGLLALMGAYIVIVQSIESAPDDPADVFEWAQDNNLLSAEDVEAVLGPGTTVTDGWITRKGCPSDDERVKYDALGVSYVVSLAGGTESGMNECVIFETGEEVYATIERYLLVDPVDASTKRYEPALVGAGIVEAIGYEVPGEEQPNDVGERAVVVSTEDLVIFIGTPNGEAMTRQQTDALAQTAVDKLLD